MMRALIARPVIANILMLLFVVGGFIMTGNTKQEFLPERSQGTVQVSVALEGASPIEIQNAIVLALEDAVRSVDGVKRIYASAQEGSGAIDAILLDGADPVIALQDIKNAVDQIQSFPQEAERAQVILLSEKETVMSLIVYGDQMPLTLRRYAEKLRDDLRGRKDVTKVQLAYPRPLEVCVEISEQTLRHYGLTLEQIATIIDVNALEQAGGTIRAEQSDFILRTNERRVWARDFADITVIDTPDAQRVTLGAIASLKDCFGTSGIRSWYNSKPAMKLDIYAVGQETPTTVEAAVKEHLAGLELPETLDVVIFENDAAAFRGRIALLQDNAFIGLVLVLIILALFLEPKLAFWVAMGIPTALLGGMLLLPLFGASINMISLFAFIVTIGVVVDDAIMVGESVFHHRMLGKSKLQAAIDGAKEMGVPILLAVSTNILAFLPMFFIPGGMGELFYQIPAVVVAVLIVSLIESLLILTAHLAPEHASDAMFWQHVSRPQRCVNAWLKRFTQRRFKCWVIWAVRHASVTIAAMVALLLITLGLVLGGWIPFSFVPAVQANVATAQAILPYGSPEKRAEAVQHRLVQAAQKVGAPVEGIYSIIGIRLDEGEITDENRAGTHVVSVLVSFDPSDNRSVNSVAFAERWRREIGEISALELLTVSGQANVAGGEPIAIELSHSDEAIARQAAQRFGQRLSRLAVVRSVDDGVQSGKPELRFTVKAQGAGMGLSADDIARQIRHRFYGAQAQRFQRDGNEVRVMVRLPKAQREHISAVHDVLIRTPAGGLVPLSHVANITQSNAYTKITRTDGRRVYPVTADMVPGANEDALEGMLSDNLLPELLREFPGLTYRIAGQGEQVDDALGALGLGLLLVLAVTYALMAAVFNSYLQPLMMMAVIPFGIIGSIWGHVLLGYEISIISLIGMIALIGVLMNDSLVLIVTANRLMQHGTHRARAAIRASCRRLRPIMLTTLTTFFGLAPMLLETSEQARFLIPMAVSIGFGLLFATVVVLFLLPTLYSLTLMKVLRAPL